MQAEIVSIGTEILLGEILDTNARYIASHLPALGIDLYWVSQVGDNRQRLVDLLQRGLERCELILCTGGLGPTEDDITREAIAQVLGEDVFVDGELERQLRSRFANRGGPMPERNLKQAWLTRSTRAIANPRGTAPGWWSEKSGRVIVAMPGPPAEMTRMWEAEVEPELRKRATGTVIVSRTVKTLGIGEGSVDEMVSDLLKSTNPTIGVYARPDGVHLRITAKSADREQGFQLIEPIEQEMRRILGTAVWGTDEEPLEAAVIKLLEERGQSISTMESCTGGLLATTLTDAPGASVTFRGGLITYMTDMKEQFGVDAKTIETYGVVSPETATAMARAVRQVLGTDVGVGVTGVAGPEPLDGHPAGEVHIGYADGAGTQSLSFNFPQSREAIKRRAVSNALLLVRRSLLASEARA
jgi:nicotinamide-nucleotide amidase